MQSFIQEPLSDVCASRGMTPNHSSPRNLKKPEVQLSGMGGGGAHTTSTTAFGAISQRLPRRSELETPNSITGQTASLLRRRHLFQSWKISAFFQPTTRSGVHRIICFIHLLPWRSSPDSIIANCCSDTFLLRLLFSNLQSGWANNAMATGEVFTFFWTMNHWFWARSPSRVWTFKIKKSK